VVDAVPNASEGGIWMAGAGLAADHSGNIYQLDGNGDFDMTLTAGGLPANGNYGNDFVNCPHRPDLVNCDSVRKLSSGR
jgi:hypothetical protein